MRQRSRFFAVLVVVALMLGACRTPSGEEIDCGELCGLAVFSVVAIPLGVAMGVGCVSGGVTRCAEGAPQDQAAPPPASAEASPSAASSAAMEY